MSNHEAARKIVLERIAKLEAQLAEAQDGVCCRENPGHAHELWVSALEANIERSHREMLLWL